jgi:hypothetical protein
MPIACLEFKMENSSCETNSRSTGVEKKRNQAHLASGVDYFTVIFSILEVDSLRKRGFDSRVIGLDEFILAILDY